MHTLLLGLLICLFLYFVVFHEFVIIKESFKKPSKFSSSKSGGVTMEQINQTNDLSFGVVEFTTVPYASASSTVKIGLQKGDKFPEPRKIKNARDLFASEIVGIKVPEGLSITFYEMSNLGGYYNSIIGPNTVDTLQMANNLEYPEPEDDNGNLLVNMYNGIGWQNRVKSFVIHRFQEIPDEFDGVFYTQKYGINDYEKIKAMGGDSSDVAEKTRQAQWQHYLDIGQSLGYAINAKIPEKEKKEDDEWAE